MRKKVLSGYCCYFMIQGGKQNHGMVLKKKMRFPPLLGKSHPRKEIIHVGFSALATSLGFTLVRIGFLK